MAGTDQTTNSTQVRDRAIRLQWGTVMNLCDSLNWEVNLHSLTAVHGGRSRAPRVGRGGPIRMIRKRR